jgi:adenylate cyclase
MSGVELQANMIDGLLRGRFVARLPAAQAALLGLCLALAGSFLQLRWRLFRSLALAIAFALAYGIAAFALFALREIWIPFLPAVFAAAAPYGYFALRALVLSERRRAALRRAFSRYLSPAVLDTVLEDLDQLRLGGVQVEATILFSDIAGFTAIVERTPPADVGRFLNRYFTAMTSIVFAHGGTLDKFAGDGLMAFWGAPVEDADHAVNACRAAVAMQDRLRSLREEMRREGLPELFVRIGISTGPVIVGNMGSEDLFNYTALGDAVNLASRLEKANKDYKTEILISSSVHERAAGTIRTRPLGAIPIRGKSIDVEVFELVGLTPSDGAGP